MHENKKLLKIGLVFSNQVDLAPYIQKICLRNRCSFGVTGLQYEHFDFIIIPDGIGVYVGLPSLAGMSLPDMPLCQYAEYFRLHLLQKYIDKDIPIIGVGEGAAMICQMPYKIGIGNRRPLFLKDDSVVEEFEVANLIGVQSIESLLLHNTIRHTIMEAEKELRNINSKKDDDDNLTGVSYDAPVGPAIF